VRKQNLDSIIRILILCKIFNFLCTFLFLRAGVRNRKYNVELENDVNNYYTIVKVTYIALCLVHVYVSIYGCFSHKLRSLGNVLGSSLLFNICEGELL